MHIVIVSIEVKPEYISEFLNITLYNAEHSILEPGIVHFDFYQEVDNPQKFSLVEVYYSKDGQAQHWETKHYKKWKDSVIDMMAQPRQKIVLKNIFPEDENWR